MKTITSFSTARLRTEEDFGFQKLIEAETQYLPLSGSSSGGDEGEGGSPLAAAAPTPLDTAAGNFKTALKAFDEALKASASNPATAAATAADEARDASWRGINGYLSAMTAHPTADVAAQAAEAKALFSKYGDPTKLAQTEESGILHNLLQDLDALAAEKRTALALDVWIGDLRSKEEAFLAAAAQRTEQEAARQTGIVKETRSAADAAYRSLTDTVNACALLEGDAKYATFIDHANALIDRQKAILKARTTKAAKKE